MQEDGAGKWRKQRDALSLRRIDQTLFGRD